MHRAQCWERSWGQRWLPGQQLSSSQQSWSLIAVIDQGSIGIREAARKRGSRWVSARVSVCRSVMMAWVSNCGVLRGGLSWQHLILIRCHPSQCPQFLSPHHQHQCTVTLLNGDEYLSTGHKWSWDSDSVSTHTRVPGLQPRLTRHLSGCQVPARCWKQEKSWLDVG